MNRRQLLSMLGTTALVGGQAHAQDKYPSKPVRIVVPLAAGSGGETFTRFFAERLTQELGQPFLIDNAPGGSGIIAAMKVKNEPADGYTILQGSGFIMSVNPVTLKDLPYDPNKDFKAVCGLIKAMAMIYVPVQSKVQDLAGLIAAAKDSPHPLNAGTYSPSYHLVLAWLVSLTGAKLANVTYRGASQMTMDVVSGQLDLGVSDVSGGASLVKAGKLRALAVTGDVRHPDFPDVPTVKESGFPEFVTHTWSSLFVRTATPDHVVTTLWGAMQKAFKSPEAKNLTSILGSPQPMDIGPEDMRAFQLAEAERIQKIARDAGFKPQ